MTCGMTRLMGCDARMTQLQHYPCYYSWLRWTVTPEYCGSGITKGFCRGATGVRGDVVWPGAKMVDRPHVAHLMDATTWWHLKSSLLVACVWRDGGRDMTANTM